jgi:HTH-type transcriptional regulator / antitoxin HipB
MSPIGNFPPSKRSATNPMPPVNPLRNLKDLGAAIRERRRQLGLDQKALAARVGVSRQWIVEVEHGKPRAAVGLVLQTLEALGLQLGIDEAPKGPQDASAAADIDAVVRRARKARE